MRVLRACSTDRTSNDISLLLRLVLTLHHGEAKLCYTRIQWAVSEAFPVFRIHSTASFVHIFLLMLISKSVGEGDMRLRTGCIKFK